MSPGSLEKGDIQGKERQAEKLHAARLTGQWTGNNDDHGAGFLGQKPKTICVTPSPHGHRQMGTPFDLRCI